MAKEKLKEIKYGDQKIAVECAKRDYEGNEIAATYATQATATDLEKKVSNNTSSISSANKKITTLENTVETINAKDNEQDGKFIIQENEINTIKSTAVDLTSNQTISGIKTFSQYILTDMVCATDQSSIARKYYRTDTADYCDVFGTVRYDNVLMGKSKRPFYTASGSDFKGEEIALLSDVSAPATLTTDGTSDSCLKLVPLKTYSSNFTINAGQYNWSISAGTSNNLYLVARNIITAYPFLSNKIQTLNSKTVYEFSNGAIFGDETTPTRIDGSTTRPYYNNTSTELALLSDVKTIYKHCIVLKMQIEETNNFQLTFSCYSTSSTELTTIDQIATLTHMDKITGKIYENGIIVPTTDTSIYQITSFYINIVSMEMKIVYSRPFSDNAIETATFDLNSQLSSYTLKDNVFDIGD